MPATPVPLAAGLPLAAGVLPSPWPAAGTAAVVLAAATTNTTPLLATTNALTNEDVTMAMPLASGAAAECYQETLRENPDFTEALVNLGQALKGLGREDEARFCLDEAAKATGNR